MSFWRPDRLARECAGAWARLPGRPIGGASIDSRDVRTGQLFFALRGERVDGHEYVRAAGEHGAGAVVVQDAGVLDTLPDGVGMLVVGDVRTALRDLARAYRASCLGLAVVGVTGSNGKTTTVRLIHAALEGSMRGSCSPKSFNNELGLPLTLLNAREDDDYVVCEMGASGPGEIARLASIARPDFGVITSIGRAHLAGFGSLAGVVREKGALVHGLKAGGVGVIPDDSPQLDEFVRASRAELVRVGAGDRAGVRVSGVACDADGIGFEVEGIGNLCTRLLGTHNARNAAMAAVVARRLGAGLSSIREGLASAGAVEMRLAPEHVETPAGRITLVNDAYNANPDSMRAALATLAGIEPRDGGRRLAVLGDMLELGPAAHDEHAALLAGVPGGIERVFAVGGAMHAAAPGSGDPRVHALESLDAHAIPTILAAIHDGDVVLLKGSRGMRLERVAEAMRSGSGVHSPQPTDRG